MPSPHRLDELYLKWTAAEDVMARRESQREKIVEMIERVKACDESEVEEMYSNWLVCILSLEYLHFSKLSNFSTDQQGRQRVKPFWPTVFLPYTFYFTFFLALHILLYFFSCLTHFTLPFFLALHTFKALTRLEFASTFLFMRLTSSGSWEILKKSVLKRSYCE